MTPEEEEDLLASLLDDFEQACAAGTESTFWVNRTCSAELRMRIEKERSTFVDLSLFFGALNSMQFDLNSVAHTSPLFERFEVIRELGRGGHGIVYEALDPLLKRKVAIKVPRVETLSNPGLRKRFVQEGELAAGIDHPHIVPVFEVGAIGECDYIVSAYCDGLNLAQWLLENPSALTAKQAAELVMRLAEGLAHCHSENILHRDLKPSNILLFPIECGTLPFWPRIMDFGLAKADNSNLADTASGSLIGTPLYMAPEQAWGRKDDICLATDVYGLGGILYELLSGKSLFPPAELAVMLDQVRMKDPIPIRKHNSQVPKELESICMKCLMKDPSVRYASAVLLRDDLKRFLTGQPPEAYRNAWSKATQRWLYKSLRSTLVRYLLLLVAMLTTVSIGLVWERRRFRTGIVPIEKAEEAKLQGIAFSQEKRRVYQAAVECDVTKPFTLETWVRPEYPKGMILNFHGVVSLQSDDGNPWVGPTVNIGLSEHEMIYQWASQSIPAGVWHHLAVVYDGDTVILFVDGLPVECDRSIQVGTEVQQNPAMTSIRLDDLYPDAGMMIGCASVDPAKKNHYAFTGSIREVRVSTSVRYKDTFKPETRLAADPDTIALYRLDSETSTTIDDESGKSPPAMAIPLPIH